MTEENERDAAAAREVWIVVSVLGLAGALWLLLSRL